MAPLMLSVTLLLFLSTHFFFLTTVKVLSIYSTTEKQQHQLFVSPLLELLKIKATYHFLLSFNAAKQDRNPVWRSKNISV